MKAKSLFAGIAVLSFIGQSELYAQTWISDTSGNWSDGTKWTGTVPTNSSSLAYIFNNPTLNTNPVATNDLTGITATSITFANTSRDVTLAGNKFTLSGDVTVSTGNWQAINTDIGLTGNRKFIVNSGQLTLGGALTDGTSPGYILKEGGAKLILKGTGSMTGGSAQSVPSGTPGGGNYTAPLVFNTFNAGTVVLQNVAALGSAANKAIQFHSNTNGAGGGGTLDLQTNGSVNGYSIFSGNLGSGSVANVIIANRQSQGGVSSTHSELRSWVREHSQSTKVVT